MGEGIVSIFAIVDSLYDSNSGDVIVIDEPELSLHPSLQKRVFSLIKDYSKDRQVFISTHSPYFIDIESIYAGANLTRVVNLGGNGIEVFQVSDDTKRKIRKISSSNINNPHIFGLEAKELFFQEDGLIIVEGQEDVLLYPLVAKEVELRFDAPFFGWGAGGASNINHICSILHDLGFKKIAVILDGDKEDEKMNLEQEFPNYHFAIIQANDIRDKKPSSSKKSVEGLLDSNRVLKEKYREHVTRLISNLNVYITDS
jgi:predicted ATP-dependent endonuclease of OLD family